MSSVTELAKLPVSGKYCFKVVAEILGIKLWCHPASVCSPGELFAAAAFLSVVLVRLYPYLFLCSPDHSLLPSFSLFSIVFEHLFLQHILGRSLMFSPAHNHPVEKGARK